MSFSRQFGVRRRVEGFGPTHPCSTVGYYASNYGIKPNVADNGPAWNQLISDIRQTGKGGRIELEPAPYKFRTALTDTLSSTSSYGIEHRGIPGATQFLADGPLLTSGDFLTPGRNSRFYGITIGATSARTAGALIKVTGDMQIGDIPSVPLMDIKFRECSMINGFVGVSLVDGAGSKGVCGFQWDGGSLEKIRGFAAGGTVFEINTPNGTCCRIANVIQQETNGVADASRPYATVHILGAADFRFDNVEMVYTRNGLIIDPGPTSRAATLFFTNCIWGQTTADTVRIEPDAAADCHALVFNGGYVDNLTGMTIKGAGVKGVTISNMSFLGCTTGGLILDGCSGVSATGIIVDGVNLYGLYAKNSASGFYWQGVFNNRFGVNGTGVRIDAGSNNYEVHGANAAGNCTTVKNVTPVDAANRIVTVF